MASEFDRRPLQGRSHQSDGPGSNDQAPWLTHVLHSEDLRAEEEPVGSFRQDVESFGEYEEPEDYYDVDDAAAAFFDGPTVAAPAGPAWPKRASRLLQANDPQGGDLSEGPDDEYEDLGYDEYFDDDDEDEIVDKTSAVTRNALEWAVVLVGAVLVALLLRASLFQAFYIPSESMETTLLIDDRVLVNKVSYRLHDINRGDIVVFVRPDDQQGSIRDLIKRVIGLPGETVEARDNSIYINGQRLIEPYLQSDIVTSDFGPTVVPEGEIFVMGDNRSQSFDSRGFGTIDDDRVIGRAFVLFWPVGRIGSL